MVSQEHLSSLPSLASGGFNPSCCALDEDRELDFEWVGSTPSEAIQRLAVPGGWLYLTYVYSRKRRSYTPIFALQTFVPDPGAAARCAREAEIAA